MRFNLFLLILLASCSAPSYKKRDIEIPTSWHSQLAGSLKAHDSPFEFWNALEDPLLCQLLDTAKQQNLDLSLAYNRILEARLLHKGKKSELYPHIDGSLTSGHLLLSKEILHHGILKHCGSSKRDMNFFEAGFDVDWEIDLFGYRRHQINASEAKEQAAEESFSDLWISLSSEIARNYIELRFNQHMWNLSVQKIDLAREQLSLLKELLRIGKIRSVDMLQSEKELSYLLNNSFAIECSVESSIHRLSVLLGYPPAELYCLLSETKDFPSLPVEQPIGMPSDLLRRRPDIRKAERELAAATEEVETAIAALFPRFSLFGFIGEVGTQLKSLGKGTGATWLAAPQLLFPIFNSKLLKQDVAFNRIEAEQACLHYQKTVLTALEEVENGIAAYRSELEKENELHKIDVNEQDAYRLTFDLYNQGFIDYNEVLGVELELIQSKEALAQNKKDLLLQSISLYKATGGGWSN